MLVYEALSELHDQYLRACSYFGIDICSPHVAPLAKRLEEIDCGKYFKSEGDINMNKILIFIIYK
jgi:hypothetical protein